MFICIYISYILNTEAEEFVFMCVCSNALISATNRQPMNFDFLRKLLDQKSK